MCVQETAKRAYTTKKKVENAVFPMLTKNKEYYKLKNLVEAPFRPPGSRFHYSVKWVDGHDSDEWDTAQDREFQISTNEIMFILSS